MRILNTQQMREADRQTIDEIGIPEVVLMENAGRQAVAAMEAAFEDLLASKVAVLCGRGNNGADIEARRGRHAELRINEFGIKNSSSRCHAA